jgi:uncharacterized phage protein gp47/JayE
LSAGFTARGYDAIVRDLLTTLVGGTVRESLTAPPEGLPVTPLLLVKRPVRQVSFLEGTVVIGAGATARQITFRFTPADFELVATAGSGEPDAIRFRPEGRRPVPGTPLTVNYFPVQAEPTELTDLSVGSVVRTILETVAREMALSYQMLDRIYDSAFLETSEAGSLDRLVALVGVTRLPATRPVVGLRFERAAREPGRITIPAGTAVDDEAGARYLTMAPLTLELGESDREVDAVGESDDTAVVEADTLIRPEILVAGIARVGNPRAARKLSEPESDEQLRRRTRNAMGAAGRGTLEALQFALAAMPEVRSLRLQEQPDGLPGTVRLAVALADTSAEARARVQARIDDVRPAGIRVFWGDAAGLNLTLAVTLRLAGSSLDPAALAALQAGIEAALRAHVGGLGAGAELRRSQLLRLALADPRVTDASIAIRGDDPAAADLEQLTLPADTVATLQAVTFAAVSFERDAGPAPPVRAVASAVLPVLPAGGVTLAGARGAILLAVNAHLATRAPGLPLSLDSLATAIRDDSRFALARSAATLTVESGSRFVQLTDGVGAYAPAANERIEAGTIDVELDQGSG